VCSFPSRLFKIIPQGAVFYYRIKDKQNIDEFLDRLFDRFWLKPAFFTEELPYFEKLEDGTNPLGFGLSIIGVADVERE
jgi:CRISPR-associated protein Cmr3